LTPSGDLASCFSRVLVVVLTGVCLAARRPDPLLGGCNDGGGCGGAGGVAVAGGVRTSVVGEGGATRVAATWGLFAAGRLVGGLGVSGCEGSRGGGRPFLRVFFTSGLPGMFGMSAGFLTLSRNVYRFGDGSPRGGDSDWGAAS